MVGVKGWWCWVKGVGRCMGVKGWGGCCQGDGGVKGWGGQGGGGDQGVGW